MLRFAMVTLLLLVMLAPAHAQWKRDGETTQDDAARKSVKGFGAHLLVVRDPRAFIKEWTSTEPGHAPRIDPAKKIQRGEQLGIFVLFAGCKPGANGLCRSELDYTVYKPDGTVYASKPNLEVWSSEPPPRSNIQLSKAILAIRFEPEDPPGRYRITAGVRDRNADTSLDLETSVILEE